MGNTIRQLREEKNMTQIRLSIELEVTQETVSAYETGRHYPSATSLMKMSKLFDASVDYILGLSTVRQPTMQNTLDNNTALFVSKYQKLNEVQKQKVLAYMQGLMD